MSIIEWLRDNYGWETKGKIVVFLVVAVVFVVALLYMAESGNFQIL